MGSLAKTMDLKLVVLLLVGSLTIVLGEKARFDNYKVYKVTIQNEKQLEVLQQLESFAGGYLFWESPVAVGITVSLMVPPHKFGEFTQFRIKNQINAEIMIVDVQRLIDMEEATLKTADDGFGWTKYNSLDEINNWLDSLIAKYPNIVYSISAGRSYEGRPLKGIKISYKAGNPGVFLDSNIHAREWITSATSTWIINELLSSKDKEVRNIAENFDWYVFPVINPDGFLYTKTTNRLWRKNRSSNGGLCTGTDLNRNFGFNWMQGGASNQPCSDTFAGKSAFSEIETKSISDYFSTLKNISTYFSFHSYSQLLLLSYGHTPEHLENFDDLLEIGLKAAQKLKERYGTTYKVGNIVETIYIASGGSMDWVKGVHKTPITYTYELRDTGRYGFLLPPEQIIPTAEETLDSIVVILNEGKKYGYH